MKLNKAGLDLIKQFEGCKLKAYPDPATGKEPWTIGYGHTGPDVKPGTVWTQLQADAQLLLDANKMADAIRPMIHLDINDNQFSALVSLTYNIGPGNFKNSTLLKVLNAGGIKKAAEEILRWDKAAGKVMAGLSKRRRAEKRLFETPVA